MNSQSKPMPESFAPQPITPAAVSPTKTFYWSVRRELWENRYLYVAPLAIAVLFLFGFLISELHLSEIMRGLVAVSAARHHYTSGGEAYDIAAGLMMGAAILMSVFYCADALYSERHDRSILFWKSLPVSDLTTVLAKVAIPLVLLPVFVSLVSAAMQLVMLLVTSALMLSRGESVAALWSQLPLFRMWLLMLYHVLTAHALWPAPVYCWFLLVSAWARRAPFLWAALPIVAIAGFEKLALHTSYFGALVGGRFIGSTATVASDNLFPTNPMTHVTPGAFLISPSLWMGLALAAIFLAGAVRLRRYQGPI